MNVDDVLTVALVVLVVVVLAEGEPWCRLLMEVDKLEVEAWLGVRTILVDVEMAVLSCLLLVVARMALESWEVAV